MKIILIMIMLISALYAEIEINQNIRALYKDVKITDEQKEYLLDNHDENIKILKKTLNKEVKKLKIKSLNEKNIISFNLTADGKINKIKFLKRSNINKLDKATKRAVKTMANRLVKADEDLEIRYIIHYRVGQRKTTRYTKNKNNLDKPISKEPYYQTMKRGTTRFEYRSEEYTRVFETSKDGFINMTQEPRSCAKRVTILTKNGQKFAEGVGSLFSNINQEAPKGKYKILIQTKKTCSINLQYL